MDSTTYVNLNHLIRLLFYMDFDLLGTFESGSIFDPIVFFNFHFVIRTHCNQMLHVSPRQLFATEVREKCIVK